MSMNTGQLGGLADHVAADMGAAGRLRLGRSILLASRAIKHPKPNQPKLTDIARNREEFKDVVFFSDTYIRALVSNAQEGVRAKLLGQFEAWFRFVLEAQDEDNAGNVSSSTEREEEEERLRQNLKERQRREKDLERLRAAEVEEEAAAARKRQEETTQMEKKQKELEVEKNVRTALDAIQRKSFSASSSMRRPEADDQPSSSSSSRMTSHFGRGADNASSGNTDSGASAYEEMLTPLELLRHYTVKGKEVYVDGQGFVRFGSSIAYPKNTKTNLMAVSYSGEREFYTLHSLHFFLRNAENEHSAYARDAIGKNVIVVRKPDRENVYNYLTGKVTTVTNLVNNEGNNEGNSTGDANKGKRRSAEPASGEAPAAKKPWSSDGVWSDSKTLPLPTPSTSSRNRNSRWGGKEEKSEYRPESPTPEPSSSSTATSAKAVEKTWREMHTASKKENSWEVGYGVNKKDEQPKDEGSSGLTPVEKQNVSWNDLQKDEARSEPSKNLSWDDLRRNEDRIEPSKNPSWDDLKRRGDKGRKETSKNPSWNDLRREEGRDEPSKNLSWNDLHKLNSSESKEEKKEETTFSWQALHDLESARNKDSCPKQEDFRQPPPSVGPSNSTNERGSIASGPDMSLPPPKKEAGQSGILGSNPTLSQNPMTGGNPRRPPGLGGPIMDPVGTGGTGGSLMGPGPVGSGGPLMGPGGPMMGPGGPMMGPGGPIMGQGGPMGPGGPIMGPGGPMMGHGGPMMGPGGQMGQGGPMMGPGGTMMGPRGPMFGSRGPMMGPSGPMMGPRGLMMGPGGLIMGPQGPIIHPMMQPNGKQRMNDTSGVKSTLPVKY